MCDQNAVVVFNQIVLSDGKHDLQTNWSLTKDFVWDDLKLIMSHSGETQKSKYYRTEFGRAMFLLLSKNQKPEENKELRCIDLSVDVSRFYAFTKD